ncbi:MAG: acyltransferase [Rhizobacter sp.]|nr:acyltransferase [Chlorobiales bacterium]
MASRTVTLASEEAASDFTTWVRQIDAALHNPETNRNDLCREVLAELYFGKTYSALEAGAKTLASKILIHSFDPRSVTLEAEYYAELDPEKFARAKPILWLWQMFDRSPAGHNVHLGVMLRQMLAGHLFKHCGDNVRLFHGIEFSFGYNVSIGDGTTVHRHVLIDDRGEVVIGKNVSVSDYVNIYSHAHAITDISNVSTGKTVIEDNVRLTYHSTVLSGMTVGEDSMVGTFGVVTRDVRPHHINVGIPAKSVRVKPGHSSRETLS